MDWLVHVVPCQDTLTFTRLEALVKKLQKSPKDEFGVTHVNLIFSKEKDKFFCLLDAPNKEVVEKHHHKAGIKCDWVMEVKSTSG
ncbi:MAG: DUF4242 domain-containing protein [Thaumarchaeota archaeon]|nr:MAG: DUF4242 domain-containing protein [Nitrososphaerota archaeon]